jgi:hypothetical protein
VSNLKQEQERAVQEAAELEVSIVHLLAVPYTDCILNTTLLLLLLCIIAVCNDAALRHIRTTTVHTEASAGFAVTVAY